MVSEMFNSTVEDRKSIVQLEAQALQIQSQKLDLERVKISAMEKATCDRKKQNVKILNQMEILKQIKHLKRKF